MKNKQTHIPYGAVTGIVLVVISLALYMTGMSFKYKAIQYLSQIPFLVGIILNAMAYSKANDGYVTFGNVFGSGFKLAMIVALISAAWGIISIFVFPEMKEKALEMARDEMLKNPGATDEQIDMSLGIMKKYWSAILIAGALFGSLMWGAIFSLIGGAIAKKKGLRPFGGV